MPKIVIIGAGSARFALDMVRDLCLSPGLRGSEVVLVDTNTQRLAWVTTIAQRYAAELGVNMTFSSESDRKAALHQAHFVISTALAGGRGLMDSNRSIQEKNGYYRGICVHAPHQQLSLMVQIAQDIKEICPQAILLQCANPVPEGCTLAYRETGVNIVGICHGIYEYRSLASMLRMDPNKVEIEAVGINHCIWAMRFLYEGQDVYAKLREWSQQDHQQFYHFWEGGNADYQTSKVTWDLFRLYDSLPIGDTSRASNPETWWYHTDEPTQVSWYGSTGGWDCGIGHKNNLQWLADSLTLLQQIAEDTSRSVVEALGQRTSEWQIVPILDSLINDRKTVQQVNIPNQGTIAGLPDDFYIEVPAIVTAQGIQSLVQYTMPDLVFYGHLIPRWLLAERIIRAYQTGDIRFLLQAYLADHKTRSYVQAVEALQQICRADWNADLHQHYEETVGYLK